MNRLAEPVMQAPELSCLHHSTGRFLWVPPQINILLGYSPKELQDENPYDYIHPEDRARVLLAGYLQASPDKPSHAVHYRFRHKAGHYCWLYSITRVTTDANGRVLQMYSNSWTSSALPDFEQQLHLKFRRAHHLEALLEVGTWTLHLPDHYLSFSPKALELLDWPGTPQMASLEHLQWLGFPKTQLLRYLSHLNQVGQRFSEEISWRDAAGKEHWFRIRGKVVCVKGMNRQLVGSIQEITKEILHRRHVERTSRRLQQVNEHLRNFNQMLAHNLRAPAGNLELLLDLLQKAESEKERQEYLIMLQELSSNLKSSLGELTEASALYPKEQVESIDLYEAWQAAERLLFVDIKAADAHIKVDFSEILYLRYNRHYLENIFYNLVSNALKYAYSSRQPVIQVRSLEEEGKVYLHIQDNGQGIDLEQHGQSLFQAGSTFHQHPEAKGIGLYMVHNQVESQGGSIEVLSEVGQGTLFKVCLGQAAELL